MRLRHSKWIFLCKKWQEYLKIKEEIEVDALQKITESCMKNELPSFEVGDTVRVQVKIKEGDTTAMIFYLKTRCKWSEKQILDVTTQEKVPEGMSEMYDWLKKINDTK